jgi:hypothetical protein
LGRTLTTIPEGHNVHKTLAAIIEAKAQMFKTGEGFDWATGEALAFGSLLSEGYGVRLSGRIPGAAPSATVTRSGSIRRPKSEIHPAFDHAAWHFRGA